MKFLDNFKQQLNVTDPQKQGQEIDSSIRPKLK